MVLRGMCTLCAHKYTHLHTVSVYYCHLLAKSELHFTHLYLIHSKTAKVIHHNMFAPTSHANQVCLPCAGHVTSKVAILEKVMNAEKKYFAH